MIDWLRELTTGNVARPHFENLLFIRTSPKIKILCIDQSDTRWDDNVYFALFVAMGKKIYDKDI